MSPARQIIWREDHDHFVIPLLIAWLNSLGSLAQQLNAPTTSFRSNSAVSATRVKYLRELAISSHGASFALCQSAHEKVSFPVVYEIDVLVGPPNAGNARLQCKSMHARWGPARQS